MTTITIPAKQIDVKNKYDVIVVGGGISGICAAIASGRAGANTLLIERSGSLGGVITLNGMSSSVNCFYNRHGELLVRGIGTEIFEALADMGALPSQWKSRHVGHIPYNPEAFQVVTGRKLREAHVDVLLMTMVTGIKMDKDTITHVICESKAGSFAYSGSVFIDTTGDCDLVAMSGAPFTCKPRARTTLLFEMANVDLDAFFQHFCDNPEDYDEVADGGVSFEEFKSNFLERDIIFIPHHSGRRIKPIQKAIQDGLYAREKGSADKLDAFGMFGRRSTGRILVNSNFFYPDVINSETDVSDALLEARGLCLEISEMLKTVMPGFKEGFVTYIAPELGIRGTRMLVSKDDVSVDHDKPVQFPDVIGIASPRRSRKNSLHNAELPLSMMLPQNTTNLIVGSGKSLPQGSRYQPYCMVIGQAAGAAAALASQTGDGDVTTLPIQQIQRLLLSQNAYLGDEARLAELGLR